MAIKKGIPMRAPRKTVSSSNSSTHQCINVTLLLETLLKNQSNLNLNNNRFRILPVSIKKKEREIIPEVINNSFGRGMFLLLWDTFLSFSFILIKIEKEKEKS